MNESLIDDYQALINSVSETSELTDETLHYISEIGVYEGYSETVANQLFQKKYIYEFIRISLCNETNIPYRQDDVLLAIEANKAKFLDERNQFLKMRESICGSDYSTLKNYSFLFDRNCPLLSKTELNLINELIKNDLKILSFVCPELVDETSAEFLVNFLNRKYHRNTEAFEILQWIADLSEDVAKKFFYLLDFEKIPYRAFSKSKKASIKTCFADVLGLTTNERKIKYMQATGFIEEDWEAEMLEDLRSDKDLCAAYIHLVNGSKKVSDHTIKCLVDLNVFYPMSGLVIDRFFETQNYRHYIITKTLSDGCFTMETGERGEILWPVYISIFSGTKYPKTREYMGHNQDFLSRIQAKRDYKDFSEEARLQLVSINQDKESLEDVLEYGDDFALKYYCQIQGFKDWEAASTFVEIVIHNELLRSSQGLYKHTHEKLLDGRLKFRYTMNRKRS